MLVYRKVFAKHYCPVCGNRVCRVRLSWLEALLREVLLFVPLAFVAIVLGGLLAEAGWLAAYTALGAGFVLAALAIYPLVEQHSLFRCSVCNKDIRFTEAVSRGGSIV